MHNVLSIEKCEENNLVNIQLDNDFKTPYNIVCLCTGGVPIESSNILLEDGFNRDKIRKIALNYDGIRIAGASHSAMIVLQNIYDLGIPIELYGTIKSEDEDP